jgi:prephenate dehydrogenase/ferredoxin-fold anticodon binding domain-containing protein
VLLVGAVGGMGRWISEKILSRETRLRLTLADIDAAVRDFAEVLCRADSFVLGRPITFNPDGRVVGVDPASYDVIILAVPTGEMERVSKAVVSQAKPGALVLDVASDKEEPLRAMQEAAPPGVSVIGTHPMFGPRVESLIGQTVVICETPSTDPRHLEAVREIVVRYGGEAHSLTPERHDELMGVVQGLPHFVHLALGETFRQGGLDLRDTLPLQTPPFRSAISTLGRMVDLSGERQAQLYAAIQKAPGSSELRKAFIAAAQKLDEHFDAESLSSSQVLIEEIARSIPPSTVGQLSAQSDEVVQARQAVEVELQKLKQSGEVCGFESQVDGKITIGRITDFDPVYVTLTGNLVEGNGKVAAIYDDASQEAARLHGISSLPKEQLLPRSHYLLLRAEEVQLWREAELDSHPCDITLGVPTIASNPAIASYLVALVPEVLEASVKGEPFDPEEGEEVRWVTFHLKVIGDRRPDRVIPSVVDFIEKIGGNAPRAAPPRPRAQSESAPAPS